MAWNIYSLCRSQLIVNFSGVIGLRIEGIVAALDLMEVFDTNERLNIARKLLAATDALYEHNDAIEKEPETFGEIEEDA